MAIRKNSKQRLVLWPEQALGVLPATPEGFICPIFGHNLGVQETAVESKALRADPNAYKPGRGRWAIGGKQISLPIESKLMGHILAGYFGNPTTTGTADPYSHKFTRGANEPVSFGAEVWDVENGRGDQHNGLVFSGLTFEFDVADGQTIVTADVDGIGSPVFDATTQVCDPVTDPPIAFTGTFHNHVNLTLNIDGTKSLFVVKGNVKMSREKSVRPILDGTRMGKYVILGRETVVWSMTALFDDSSTVRKLATGLAPHSIELVSADPDTTMPPLHYLSVKSDEIQLYITATPSIGNANEIELTVEGRAYYANGVNESAVVATLVNGEATAQM